MTSLSTRLSEGSISDATRLFFTYQLLKFQLTENFQIHEQPLPFHPDNLFIHNSNEILHYNANIKTHVSYTFDFDRCLIPPEVIAQLLYDGIPILESNAMGVQSGHLQENIFRLGCITYEV